MLSLLTKAPLRIGLGRGNAPLEYEAFGVAMAEAKDRFQECWEIIQLALKGRPFTYHGRYLKIDREITVRPYARNEQITFIGAIGHPTSAEKIGAFGLAPLVNGGPGFEVHRGILAQWNEAIRRHGGNTALPRIVSPLTIVADTDEEARALARRYVPRWYQLQLEHYAFDAVKYASVPGYQPFTDGMKRRHTWSNPDNLDSLIDVSFIGSPDTVIAQGAGLSRPRLRLSAAQRVDARHAGALAPRLADALCPRRAAPSRAAERRAGGGGGMTGARNGARMTRTSKSTVGYLLRQTNIALSRALQQRLARHNLTSPQMIFMREVWLEEGLSQAELEWARGERRVDYGERAARARAAQADPARRPAGRSPGDPRLSHRYGPQARAGGHSADRRGQCARGARDCAERPCRLHPRARRHPRQRAQPGGAGARARRGAAAPPLGRRGVMGYGGPAAALLASRSERLASARPG